MKPIIGITCKKEFIPEIYPLTSNRAAIVQRSQYILQDYIDRIIEAGGLPVPVPVYDEMESVKQLVDRFDGIIFMGGADITPEFYGERMDAACGGLNPEQDMQELALAKYMIEETDKPVLGICRGIQVINVALGGNLYQDLAKQGTFEHHRCSQLPGKYPVHDVNAEKGTKLYEIFGEEKIHVNSYHHQAVKNLGKGLIASGITNDHVVEAVEYPGKKFVVGVQWHPEMMFDSEQQKKIFRKLVEAAEI